MDRRLKAALGVAGAALAGWIAWGAYSTYSADRLPYAEVGRIGDVELRRYPRLVAVETTAPDEMTAFRRLFGYISGENEGEESVAMTAPVATDGTGGGQSMSMTAPVETVAERIPMTAPVEIDVTAVEEAEPTTESTETTEGVRMSFYLPAEYDYESAPRPTNPDVELVEQSARTLAVLRFSGYATDGKTERKTEDLLERLGRADASVDVLGEPFLMQYNDPWTPPFMRRNEVAVEVRRTKRGGDRAASGEERSDEEAASEGDAGSEASDQSEDADESDDV